MKGLIEVIAKELVDYPEAVLVVEKEDDNVVTLELKVAQEDMGKIIGKQGRIAKAIRTIAKSAGSHTNKKIVVEIIQ